MRKFADLFVVIALITLGLLAVSDKTQSSGIGSSDVRSSFACSPIPIGMSDSVNGSLESGDCVDTNTALYDGYTFTGNVGEKIDIALGSEVFVPSLRLVQGNYPGGTVIATGSDAGAGTRRITSFTIPASGTYTIVVSSNAVASTGGYTLSLEPTIPRVDLIQRTSPNPAIPGSTVGYSVFFSSAVTGVDAADFVVSMTGVTGAFVSNVAGSGSIYTVSVNSGSGVGSLRLDLIDNDTIVNTLGMPLGGIGLGNGSFTTGPSYTMAVPTPTPSPTPPQSTQVVTNINDSGPGSLRQAIEDVVTGGNVVFSALFDSPRTILLESELRIVRDVTISGPGPALLTVSGNNAVRVFNIGGSSPGATVSISGLTIANGRAPSNDFGGGVEKNFGDLRLSNCAVTGSSVPGTGSFGSGGGIDNFQGPLTITACRISGNASNGSGGGIQSEDGDLTISDSTISGNAGRSGAGIVSINGNTVIRSSTISGNTAVTQGGGAVVQESNLTLSNSTISGNTAGSSNLAGAALFITSSMGERTHRLSSSTIANNTAPANSGGGVVLQGPSSGTATAIFKSSILAGNAEPTLRIQNATAAIQSDGFNLATGSGNGFFGQASDKINTAAGISSLADNGGPTQTHSLLPGSAAIDSGISTGLVNDQRGSGFQRVVDLSTPNSAGSDGSDIGAFELQSEPLPAFAAVSGRVTTPTGLGLRNAVVTLTDPQGLRRTATTSSFGIFNFANIPTGVAYIVSVNSKRYRFAPQNRIINGDVTTVDFIGLE